MKITRIISNLIWLAILLIGMSSCEICRECIEYEKHTDVVRSQEEYCARTKSDVDTWEFNFKSSRAANNSRFVCEDK